MKSKLVRYSSVKNILLLMPQKPKRYLSDPHLFYHLESPIKICQLLNSGLYFLQDNVLVSSQSKQKFPISDYTISKVPKQTREKYTRSFNYNISDIINRREDLNKSKRQNAMEDALQKSPLKLTSRSPSKLNKRKSAEVGEKVELEFIKDVSKRIKGLKQFRNKIL